ncbi:MAG: tetratricopeptide repeat protein [Dongiaceae bacterium]
MRLRSSILVLCAAAACGGAARADDPALRGCANDDALAQVRAEACSALIADGETVGRPTGWALIQRGFALGEAGDLGRARADFEAALRLAPDLPDAHLGRGLVLWATGDAKTAIPELDAALALQPAFAQAFNARGLARAALGELDRAIDDYDAALRIAPAYVAALIHRGTAHARRGDWRPAIADYKAALALLPRDADSEDYRDIANDGIDDAASALATELAALRRQPASAVPPGDTGSPAMAPGRAAGASALAAPHSSADGSVTPAARDSRALVLAALTTTDRAAGQGDHSDPIAARAVLRIEAVEGRATAQATERDDPLGKAPPDAAAARGDATLDMHPGAEDYLRDLATP